MQHINTEEARDIVKKSQTDPYWWTDNVLGKNLWIKQVEILDSVVKNKRTAVPSCHAAGKSFISANTVLWWESVAKGAVAITTAPTFRQVKKVVWEEIRRCYKEAKYPIGGECLTTELRMDDAWYAMGLSTKDPDSFQGKHSYCGRLLVIIDEASGIPRELWPAIEGITTGDDCRILEIGNPTDPVSQFAEDCKSPLVNVIKISCFDTPNFFKFDINMEDIRNDSWRDKIGDAELPAPYLITPGWVAERYKAWGETSPLFQSRCLANFPDVSENKLIPLSWLVRAQEMDLDIGAAATPNILSVDVARYGTDKTVMFHRHGGRLRKKFSGMNMSTVEVTNHAILCFKDSGADTIHVDVVGVGAGVVDMLEAQGYPVVGINGANKPRDPDRFMNTRAEAYWNLREALDPSLPGDVDMDESAELAVAELCDIEYKATGRGRIQIESKDDIRRRLLRSPDDGDAVMLCYAQPDPEDKGSKAGVWGR